MGDDVQFPSVPADVKSRTVAERLDRTDASFNSPRLRRAATHSWPCSGRPRSIVLDLKSLDEGRFIALSPALNAKSASHGVRSAIYRVDPTSVSGRDCIVGFEFKDGRLGTATLCLIGALSEEWRGREYEMAGLEEEARVHAEWLGQLLGSDVPVRDRTFDWGRIWVTLDPKGWNTGITIAPC